jgi:uncharacterized protein (TIGR02246 family)
MRRTLLIIVAVIAASLLTFGQAIGQRLSRNSTAEQEVRQLENERQEAILRNDVRALDRLMADDYVVTTVGGRVANKSDELALYRSGSRRTQSWDADDIRVRIYGNVAVVTGQAVVKDTLRGEGRDFQFRFTHVWVRRQGRWQIVARHTTDIARQ